VESLALETCGCGFTTSLELVTAAWAFIGAEMVTGVVLGIGLIVGEELVTELVDCGGELKLVWTLTTSCELVSKLD
jgi:hypothetical protein